MWVVEMIEWDQGPDSRFAELAAKHHGYAIGLHLSHLMRRLDLVIAEFSSLPPPSYFLCSELFTPSPPRAVSRVVVVMRRRLTGPCAPVQQTITGAMSTLSPPIPLELTENEARVNYVQDVASQPYFDYPPVRTAHWEAMPPVH